MPRHGRELVETSGGAGETPWQLRLFSKAIKKQQKFALLVRQIGDAKGKECLLITNGDNNGALNWHFRAHGGRWRWVELEAEHIPGIEQLLEEEVLEGGRSSIPVDDESCDIVVSIDVHEHLENCSGFNRELRRVTRPGGIVIVTTPNGDAWKSMTIIKNLVGMTKERYGHIVSGYNVEQIRAMMAEVDLVPDAAGSYSRFFTELVELVINLAYVMVLSRKRKAKVEEGTIAPVTGEQFRSVEKQYRLYSLVYPALKTISLADKLLFFSTGYAVSVRCHRPR